jgi:hypothetical protein
MTTFVSSFINLNNSILNKYIIHGNNFLRSPVSKIVFIEEHIYQTYFSKEKYPITYFIIIPTPNYPELPNFSVVTPTPGKDTLKFMFIMCEKTEWVKRAIEVNPFFSHYFIWIDFGISHILSPLTPISELLKIISNNNDENDYCIRIAGGKAPPIPINIYQRIHWFFLGGIFGGSTKSLLTFAEKMREKVNQIITEKKSIMWEVNVWYLIYLENPELFDIYLADHNETMFTNYPRLTNLVQEKEPMLKWTLVTAYFDLTKCSDASDEIKKKDRKHYLHHAKTTLELPYNMVIYCERENFQDILALRPKYLYKNTRYIIVDFEKFQFYGKRNETFSDFRKKIASNRIKHPYHFDPRNTPSYYLLCMSRYIMLKEVIKSNPFISTHFAWINICIERMGIQNLLHLPEALSIYRDKFSTCYIDYLSQNFIQNTSEYFMWGRCTMCSGFFTGNIKYMYEVCDLIENKFLEYLDQGYGHADEQLYSPVYFEHPELFEHYYGDYAQMITNYVHVYENPESILRNFITNSFHQKNYPKCLEACQMLFRAKCELSSDILQKLKIIIEYIYNSKDSS